MWPSKLGVVTLRSATIPIFGTNQELATSPHIQYPGLKKVIIRQNWFPIIQAPYRFWSLGFINLPAIYNWLHSFLNPSTYVDPHKPKTPGFSVPVRDLIQPLP